MEKDALLEIIIHDLKELEMLAQNVKGNTQLSKAFFKLTRNRINSIVEEIEMLEELSLPETRSSEPRTVKTDEEKISAPEVLPKQEAEQVDFTPPPPSSTRETPNESKSVSEPLPEKEITPVSDENPTETKKEEPIAAETPEEKSKEKDTSVNKEDDPAPGQATEKKKGKDQTKGVLGEKLVKEKDSFNEQIWKNQKTPNSKRSFSNPPISDLKKAMGINDRFFFQRELFGGNAEVMNQTLEQLNQMQGINEAQNFLLANFNWDPENEAVLNFMELVERRYL
jgi:outer membrane biosynthesis protein TonB